MTDHNTTFELKIGRNGGVSVERRNPGYIQSYFYFSNARDFSRWFKKQIDPMSTPEKKPASG